MKPITINKKVVIQKIDDRLVAFDIDNSRFYSFNKTAGIIFQLLKKQMTEKEIADYLCKKYNVNYTKAVQDVKNTIIDLQQKKIITRSARTK